MAASTVARNQQDVDQMSKKDRLWDSLSYTYGRQADQSNESFNKAINQQDRNLLQRGMQRSSYGMQTLGDLQNQKIKAQNDIGYAKIADYENRLFQLEQQEKADEQWERQFAEGQRQFDTNMAFQQSEAERAQKNTEWTQAFQQSEAARDQANTVWNQNFQQGQADREQGNWEKQFAFSQEQWNTQKDQWDKEFNYQQMSDDQKLSYNYVAQIIANGNDPSDDLLRRAGLSREDANAMKAQAQKSSGGGGRRTPTTTPEDDGTQNPTGPLNYNQFMTVLGLVPSLNPGTNNNTSTETQRIGLDGPVNQEFIDRLNNKAKQDGVNKEWYSTLAESNKKKK